LDDERIPRAMSQENVEIVRAQYASFGQLAESGEVRSWVLSYFDPNCEYRPVEEVDAVCGHQALIGWTKRWLEAWSSYSDTVEEIIDGGEIVVAAISITGRGRTSGIEVRQRFFHVFEMHEGRILRLREYLDRDSALEAAGLRE
jgi:ketosteroid isomerase-like protein